MFLSNKKFEEEKSKLEDFWKALQELQGSKYAQITDLKVEDSGHTVGGLLQIAGVIVGREVQNLYTKQENFRPPEAKTETSEKKQSKKDESSSSKEDPGKSNTAEKMEVEEVVETKSEPVKKEKPVEIIKRPPKPKLRQTAYQETDKVIKVFYAKKCKEEDVKIAFFEQRLEWSIKLAKTGEIVTGVDYLWSKINPEKSSWSINPYKLEVFMMKQSAGQWEEVFRDEQPVHSGTPYSTKTDWESKQRALEAELEDDSPEGEAALMELFKKIYADSTEDTRRAMVKSYQTSGGTVLSTNWNEVKNKDYEGKDAVVPEGQIRKEWKDFI